MAWQAVIFTNKKPLCGQTALSLVIFVIALAVQWFLLPDSSNGILTNNGLQNFSSALMLLLGALSAVLVTIFVFAYEFGFERRSDSFREIRRLGTETSSFVLANSTVARQYFSPDEYMRLADILSRLIGSAVTVAPTQKEWQDFANSMDRIVKQATKGYDSPELETFDRAFLERMANIEQAMEQFQRARNIAYIVVSFPSILSMTLAAMILSIGTLLLANTRIKFSFAANDLWNFPVAAALITMSFSPVILTIQRVYKINSQIQ